jgi:hypothetical protein
LSIFASLTQSTPILVPFDPPNTVTVRRLTGREVEDAQAAHLRGLVNGQSPRGWSSAFHRLLTKGLGTEADVVKVMTDPLSGFDRLSVARAGLVAWSYDRPIKPTPRAATKDTPAYLDDPVADLSDEALEFIAIEVMRLTKPERFAESPRALQKEI